MFSSVFWNANTHISKIFYSNISESQTYSKYYHCQANIPILSLCYIPSASVQTHSFVDIYAIRILDEGNYHSSPALL